MTETLTNQPENKYWCKTCGHYQGEHHEEEKYCQHPDCLCPQYRFDIRAALMPGLLGLGITAALGNIMFKTIFNRRLGTMFGAGDVEINAKDVMYVMIDGFMGYYQEKAEEITKLKEQVEVLKEELEQKKTQYDELSAEVSKGHEIADQWKSKYMRMVANAKHKK